MIIMSPCLSYEVVRNNQGANVHHDNERDENTKRYTAGDSAQAVAAANASVVAGPVVIHLISLIN
jgi:hypothetical protein